MVPHDEIKALFYEVDEANRGYITWRQLSDCLYSHMKKKSMGSLPHIVPPSTTHKKGASLRSPIRTEKGKRKKSKQKLHKDIYVGSDKSNFASRAASTPFGDECEEGRRKVSKVGA